MRQAACRGTGRCLVALALLAHSGCGPSVPAEGEQGREVAARFLEQLRAGKVEDAWQGTSSEFKSLMGEQSLRDYVKSHPALRAPAEYAEGRKTEFNGHRLAEHVFRGTTQVRKKSTPATIRVLLAPAADGPKVERVTVE